MPAGGGGGRWSTVVFRGGDVLRLDLEGFDAATQDVAVRRAGRESLMAARF
jgi:hypothetical protein